jgi:ATP-dependent exoDNAse (exonuclease V) beta subunit
MDLLKLNAKDSRELEYVLFGEYDYNDEEHTYKQGDTTFTSVTQFVGEFFPKFDREEQAEAYSQRLLAKGITKSKEEILQEWEDKASFGTTIHNEIELQLINPIRIPPQDSVENKLVKDALHITRGIASLHNVRLVYPEVKIFSKKYGLAGTIDLLMITDKNEIILVDWKTSNSIWRGDKYNTIYDKLPDNNYTKYKAQLSTYSYLLQDEGYKVTQCFLAHLKPFNHQERFTLYSFAPLFETVRGMLNDRKKEKNPSGAN